jgi:hypothetical protein
MVGFKQDKSPLKLSKGRARMEGAAQKLRATHFVSLRITNPAFQKRAEDGAWNILGLMISSCALAVRSALCADHPVLSKGFVPLQKLHVSLAVVGIVPAQLELLVEVGALLFISQ